MPYGIEEANNKIIKELSSNLIKIEEYQNKRLKKINALIKNLKDIKEREYDNQFFLEYITSIDDNIKFLEIIKNIDNVQNKRLIIGKIDEYILKIVGKIDEWLELIKIKSEEVHFGNKYLKGIKIHQLKTRFYARIKEFNPDYTMVIKHPINELQAKIQRGRTDQELLKLDIKDPITGGRSIRKYDNVELPGSLLTITQGHHRVYELYRRYLQGRINGDIEVEIIIDKKFI